MLKERPMTFSISFLLFAAGLSGGAVNALSGGGTLLTFPALLYAGLPAAAAAASNAVAISPSHIFATIPDRDRLPAASLRWVILIVAAVAGSAGGAALLTGIPPQALELSIPALIALATLLFACAPLAQATRPESKRMHMSTLSSFLLVCGASIYGGFFGAGFGMVLTAILAFTEATELRTVKVQKNVLASCVSIAATLVFIGQGSIDWSKTLIVFAGSVLGGYMGGIIIKYVSPGRVRIVIIVLGVAMFAFYGLKYWA
jgi:uncharacterized protein